MSNGRDGTVRLVETMRMTADGLRPTAYGPDEDEIRIVEDLSKAKTPRVRADRLRLTADGQRPTNGSPRRAAGSRLRVTGSSTML